MSLREIVVTLLEVQNLKVYFPVKHGVLSRVRQNRRLTFTALCA